MSRLTQEATTTQTTVQEVVLSPKLRLALQTKLTAYAKLATEKKALKARMDKLVAELDGLRDEADEMSVSLEGFGTVTLVAGSYKVFNKKRYVTLGGELALYEQAMEEKPRAAYTKVTVPSAPNDDE